MWLSLGALLLAGGLVAVGVEVAPQTFYDHFVWEDLWGPLTVDAHQCKTNLDAPCQSLGPSGVLAKDGYTITSELTYGIVLAALLYGIYQGLFRKYAIVADGWFVGALLPWILLGPTGRVLEDANVFLRAGTDHDPGPFAFVFISPVIYIFIALMVIAAMLLGVRARERPQQAPFLVGGALAAGLAVVAWLNLAHGPTSTDAWFTALPPMWFVVVAFLAAFVVHQLVARRWGTSINLVVFSLGLPLALGCLWLIGRWMSGDVWAPVAWNGRFYALAGAFVLLSAIAIALLVYLAARRLAGSALERRWREAASRMPESAEKRVGWAAVIALGLAALKGGILPNVASFFDALPDAAIPIFALVGAVLLAVFIFLHVGRESARRPGAIFLFASGINAALVLGHMIDGLATWVALDDPLGFGIPPYSEKHPFSEFLLRYWGGALYPAAKLAMVLVVAWLLDRETTKHDAPALAPTPPTPPPEAIDETSDAAHTPELSPMEPESAPPVAARAAPSTFDERNLVGLVKMAIFVLGFAPGLRDLLRLAMGV